MRRLGDTLRQYFNLSSDDRAEEGEIIAAIYRNISFKGSNLWTLIFAIIVASVGLNINSTAVIIGAMLISPLMGPIMGVGLGITISDFEVVRRGIKNLFVAAAFSIATSGLYFYVTPLHNPTSEILARTTPTIWDVFIAFAGGVAGIIGITRKEKSNVIPGVAIATALMPPLCTAGYGLATQHWYFMFGAMYLFFINSVFICIATVLILRFMHFHKREFQNERRRKRVMRYIILVVIITAAPSIWLAYWIVQKAVFENAAEQFVRQELNFTNTQVVTKTFDFEHHHPKIELLLIGQTLDSVQIDSLQRRLPHYKLDSTRLIVRQGLDARQQIDFAQVKASILDEVFKDMGNDTIVDLNSTTPKPDNKIPDLGAELHVLYPQVRSYALSRVAMIHTDSLNKHDSVLLFIATIRTPLKRDAQRKMKQWLLTRVQTDTLQMTFRQVQ